MDTTNSVDDSSVSLSQPERKSRCFKPLEENVRRSGRNSTLNAVNYNEAALMTKAFNEKKREIVNKGEQNVQKICGATALDGKVMFLFKWKNQKVPTFISSEEANLKYPYAVMSFYESQIIWDSTNTDDIAESQ